MISRRAPRSSKPQESLKQFALNNSKGIDVTKAPTDTDTVLNSVNLVSNPDGSLSVRKPIAHRPEHLKLRFPTLFSAHLFDNRRIVFFGNDEPMHADVEICTPDGSTEKFVCRFYDAGGTRRELEMSGLSSTMFANCDFNAVNTPTSTVIGNVSFNLGAYIYEGFPSNVKHYLFDSSKYDEGYTPYRYLRIYEEPYEDTVRLCVDIVNPEPNVLSTADDGSLAFDMNLAQDNPYAVRDVYNAHTPAVKGILAYAYSKISNDGSAVSHFEERGVPTVSESIGATATDVEVPTEAAPVQTFLNGGGNVWELQADLQATTDSAEYPKVVTVTVSGTVSGGVLNDDYTLISGNVSIDVGDAHYSREVYVRKTADSAPFERVFKFENVSEGSKISASIHLDVVAYTASYSVELLTESVKNSSYRILNSVAPTGALRDPVLKAFCNFPTSFNGAYAAWFRSLDGNNWEPCPLPNFSSRNRIAVKEFKNHDTSDSESAEYDIAHYYPLSATGRSDDFVKSSGVCRADVYVLRPSDNLSKFTYLFKIISPTALPKSDPVYADPAFTEDVAYGVSIEYGRAVYNARVSASTEFAYWSSGNPISGNLLYQSKKLFSYGGKDFENIVYSSEPGSFITPLSYIADVATSATNKVTTVVPWKSYIVTATETSLSILIPQDVGWTSKLLSSNLGIPVEDTKCCLPGLNGVIFKSNDKVYMMYPNAYAGDDTYVYITDLSKPVEHILSEYSGNGSQFAFATNDEYILMLPKDDETHCLRYSYDSKSWTYCIYPIVAKSVKIISLTNIVLLASDSYGYLTEVQFDSTPVGEGYCDSLTYSSDGLSYEPELIPIPFELDTGMKTDNLSLQKQFVESKFIFATEDDREMFPVDVTIAVDGDPNITHLDVNSDSPFWKNSESSRGVVGTSFRLTNDTVLGRSSSGIVRQLVLRYSGKGRSVRHILKGSSHSNFRLYETYVRYKILNVKR